ncbi:MAG: hypothetical protein EP326_04820 [Deltaproteobacteria bacterium]|nr:MAG: hypothetical protein EP326_04820 [Deltaproteobacteria bacterium]
MLIDKLSTTKKFITACNTAIAAVSTVMFMVRLGKGDPFPAQLGIAICIILCLVSLMMIVFKEKYEFGAISIFLIATILHPIRVFYTGGVYSFAFVWLIPLILAVFWCSGIRLALISALAHVVLIVTLYALYKTPPPHEFFESTHLARNLTLLFSPLLAMVMFSFFAGQEQTKYLEITKNTERKTLDTLGTTIAHEINSPLMALMASVDKVEKKYELEKADKEKIHLALREIKKRIDLIESLSNEDFQKEKYTHLSSADIYVLNKDDKKIN